MKIPFDAFIATLSQTNATLDYFCDFNKAKSNTEKIAIKLNQLNFLIGQSNLKSAVYALFQENPSTFEVLNLLLAVRNAADQKTLNAQNQPVPLNAYFNTAEGVFEFLEKTGLSELLSQKTLTNLVDYVFGVEVGLDTHARKNRGGSNMEKWLAQTFKQHHIPFQARAQNHCFPTLLGLGEDAKHFDFSIKTPKKTYLIETNFYNSGGSKLNEVARSYSLLSNTINANPDYTFVWITDGLGWLKAKNKLEEAYHQIPYVFSLETLKIFIEHIKNELQC